MADDEYNDAPPISGEEDSDPESVSDAEYEADPDPDPVDNSQELTVEEGTEFAQEETEEELCDYEMLDELDETLDQESYLVSRASSIIYLFQKKTCLATSCGAHERRLALLYCACAHAALSRLIGLRYRHCRRASAWILQTFCRLHVWTCSQPMQRALQAAASR